MHIEALRDFCLQLKEVTEAMPFDKEVLVFKVKGKMFLLTNINDFTSINVKCNPEYAIELREKYTEVTAGYHMNKKHWNTIKINQTISDNQIYQWIKDSYWLVVEKLPKKQQKELR